MAVIRGACIRKGQDIWWLETINVKVGIVKLVNEAEQTVTVETSEGDRILNPRDSLLFAAAPKERKKRAKD